MSLSDQNFETKRLTSNDVEVFKELIQLFVLVFEEKDPSIVSDEYLKELLAKPDFIVFATKINNRVVGGLTAYELKKYYSASKEIYIYDIAVLPEFQRKGLGKKLLSEIKKYAVENGINEMFVQANEEDEHAIEFYRSTGGDPEKVIHFNYLLNKK